MLPVICMVLRLNEVELLQWYLFVYLFVKEDLIFSQLHHCEKAHKNIEFERCDEMIISSAIFAKAISNKIFQSAGGLKDPISKSKFDQDSHRLITNLNLDEEYLNSMF